MPHLNHVVTLKDGSKITIPNVAVYQAEQTAKAHARIEAKNRKASVKVKQRKK